MSHWSIFFQVIWVYLPKADWIQPPRMLGYPQVHTNDGDLDAHISLTDSGSGAPLRAEECEHSWPLGLTFSSRLFVGFRSTYQKVR